MNLLLLFWCFIVARAARIRKLSSMIVIFVVIMAVVLVVVILVIFLVVVVTMSVSVIMGIYKVVDKLEKCSF